MRWVPGQVREVVWPLRPLIHFRVSATANRDRVLGDWIVEIRLVVHVFHTGSQASQRQSTSFVFEVCFRADTVATISGQCREGAIIRQWTTACGVRKIVERFSRVKLSSILVSLPLLTTERVTGHRRHLYRGGRAHDSLHCSTSIKVQLTLEV